MSPPVTNHPVVQFIRVSKSFGPIKAVDEISFEIHRGEFFSLLGPSGCGKTTTLRLLAGLEQPDADGGEIRLLGQAMNRKPAYERPLSMVFQNYALFPHLQVQQNVAFGLEQRKLPRQEIDGRVERALELVRLDPGRFARRMPSQLSGGQRQRVALARALVLEPAILLLDEPLGAIDLKLRREMQLELKSLNRELGITFIYVTHDQEEALTMSDRIAVMEAGRVAQLGSPAEVYENPRTAFVAGFVGLSNFFEGRVAVRPSGSVVQLSSGTSISLPRQAKLENGTVVRLAVRPEWMELRRPGAAAPGQNLLAGTLRDIIYLGERVQVIVAIPALDDLTVALQNEGQLMKPLAWKKGEAIAVAWDPEDCQLLEEA